MIIVSISIGLCCSPSVSLSPGQHRFKEPDTISRAPVQDQTVPGR